MWWPCIFHFVLLLSDQLLYDWKFDKKTQRKWIILFPKRKDVNDLLQKITPTIFVSRIPRTLNELAHWKVSEYRIFLDCSYYVMGLTKNTFADFWLLAGSVFILSKEGISVQDLHTTDSFVTSRTWMGRDILLTICNNRFIFEDLNGFIVK